MQDLFSIDTIQVARGLPAMNWFPLWNNILESRKVQGLPGDVFKFWINLLSLACKRDDHGRLPDLEDIAFALRLDEERAKATIEILESRGLIDRVDGRLQVHDWDHWQLPSYNSTKRVREHRKRQKEQAATLSQQTSSVNGTATETDMKQHETFQERSCNHLELEEEREEEPPLPPLTGGTGVGVPETFHPANGVADATEPTPPRANPVPIPVPKANPNLDRIAAKLESMRPGEGWPSWVRDMAMIYEHSWIGPAIREAIGSSTLKKKYVHGILKRWAREGPPPEVANPRPKKAERSYVRAPEHFTNPNHRSH